MPTSGSRTPPRNNLHSEKRLRFFVPGWTESAHRRLVALLDNVDLIAPLEQFDAALILTAEALGLRHVQHHAVSTDCVGTLSERVNLDVPKDLKKLERKLGQCGERRSKRCAPRMQAECKAVVRRVAQMDHWLYEHAQQRFRLSAARAGSAHAARLRSFSLATRGVWRGGPPSRARCKFVRLTGQAQEGWRPLDFERHLCTPGPQAVMEPLTRDTKYDRHAVIVPNTEACQASPLAKECSVPLPGPVPRTVPSACRGPRPAWWC